MKMTHNSLVNHSVSICDTNTVVSSYKCQLYNAFSCYTIENPTAHLYFHSIPTSSHMKWEYQKTILELRFDFFYPLIFNKIRKKTFQSRTLDIVLYAFYVWTKDVNIWSMSVSRRKCVYPEEGDQVKDYNRWKACPWCTKNRKKGPVDEKKEKSTSSQE